MHQDFMLFATISMAIIMAFIGGYVAKRLGLPPLVGYLLAGMAIGPFTPGFVGDSHAANQLAEMGVIFMMFGVGLHFSLKDLWTVRRVAIPGAILQSVVATLCGFALSQAWGWSVSASLVLGVAISIASTVVLLRGLSDNGLLNTVHGKVAVGWLVLEDLATVAILVLLPTLVNQSGSPVEGIGLALIKTAIFIAIMLFVGAKVMPWLLVRIAHTRSRELFILAVVGLALGTAFAAYELFGVSLALGAFLAGVIIGESDVSHQVGAELVPFRDVFAVLFFVSVGMLVNPTVVITNAGHVLALTALIVVGKYIIVVMLGLILPASGRTLLVVGAGLSQIGEFSFIVGQAGVALGLLTTDQYGLILAGSLLSIIVNPLIFRALPRIEQALQRFPGFWRRMDMGVEAPLPLDVELSGHVVIVGYGRVGRHIGQVLQHLELPFLVIEQDAAYAAQFQKEGILTLFGDAANSEILTHSGLEHARALVVTVPNETTAELVVASAHQLAPNLPIIARAATTSGGRRLMTLGGRHVIHPEMEGGLEMVRYLMLRLGYTYSQIQPYIDTVRREAYESATHRENEYPVVDQLLRAVQEMEIVWQPIEETSSVIGKSIAEANIRSTTGASIIALVRDQHVFPNPKSEMRFQQGDLIGLIGSADELAGAAHMVNPTIQTTLDPIE